MTKRTVSIIGFGRFGQVLAGLLHQDFQLLIHDQFESLTPLNASFVPLEQALQAETLFICIPIHQFEKFIQSIADRIPANTTVIDTCSVKVYPVEVMKHYLPETTNIIASHPLFGPDSIKTNKHLKMVMHAIRDKMDQFSFWKDFFDRKKIEVIDLIPEEHDRHMANTQGVTHYIGRILQTMDIQPTEVDTLGFKKLLEVEHMTVNDTWELYCDMQKFNPYSKEMMQSFERAKENVNRTCEEHVRNLEREQ